MQSVRVKMINMHPETLKLIDKLNWIYRVIDTAYLFRNEDVNDFSKRVILRIIFVQEQT